MSWLRTIYLQIRYNPLLSFVIGGLSAWALDQVAGQFFTRAGVFGIVAALVSVILTVLLYQVVLWAIRRLLPAPTPRVGVAPAPHRGLILLFGRTETALKAIEPHRNRLDFIWWVVTDKTAEELRLMRNHWWGSATATPELVHDEFSPGETENAVARAISHAAVLGLKPADLICDITGGTKAMTVGAFAAGLQQSVALQIVPARYDKERKSPVPLDAIQIHPIVQE